MKTIKQLAEELGVSKQSLQKRITRNPLKQDIEPYISIVNGTKYIDDNGEKIIKDVYTHTIDMSIPVSIDKQASVSIDTGMDKGVYMSIDDNNIYHISLKTLTKQLEVKDKQIADLSQSNKELTAALENATASLKAAQALHAGTMQAQLIESSENNIDNPHDIFDNVKNINKKSLWQRIFKNK